jgi:HSP20 family protein
MSIWNTHLPSIRKNDLLSLQEEMNDFFERVSDADFFAPTFMTESRKFFPKVEVRETNKNYIVSAELPGMDENEFNVSMKDNNLILEGEKKEESRENEGDWYRSEFKYGHFYRSIPFEKQIKANSTSAIYDNGVLKVTLMKSIEDSPSITKIKVDFNKKNAGTPKEIKQ